MNKKILASFILFVLCISNVSYGLDLALPVWSETEAIEKANAEALGENFLNIESESAILIEQTTRKSFI